MVINRMYVKSYIAIFAYHRIKIVLLTSEYVVYEEIDSSHFLVFVEGYVKSRTLEESCSLGEVSGPPWGVPKAYRLCPQFSGSTCTPSRGHYQSTPRICATVWSGPSSEGFQFFQGWSFGWHAAILFVKISSFTI